MTREKAETKRIAGPDMLGNGKGKMSWCETKGITKGGGPKKEKMPFLFYTLRILRIKLGPTIPLPPSLLFI